MSTTRLVFASIGGSAWSQIVIGSPDRRDTVVLVLPGEDIAGHEVAVPGATPRQMQAAAIKVLEDDLATGDDSIAVVGAVDGRTRLVCVMARDRLAAWHASAVARGLRPDRIVADYSLISRPEQADVLRVAHSGDSMIVRGSKGGFACQPDLLSLLAAGRHVERVDLEQEAMAAVRSGRIKSAPDLCDAIETAADAGRDRRTMIRIAAAASVSLLLVMAAPWVQALRLNMAAEQARSESRELAKAMLPQASRIVNARAQLEEALLPVGGGNGALTSSRALLAGLAAAPTVQINRLDTDGSNVLAQLSMSSADDMAALREQLTASGVSAIEAVSEGLDGRVTVELQLRASR